MLAITVLEPIYSLRTKKAFIPNALRDCYIFYFLNRETPNSLKGHNNMSNNIMVLVLVLVRPLWVTSG